MITMVECKTCGKNHRELMGELYSRKMNIADDKYREYMKTDEYFNNVVERDANWHRFQTEAYYEIMNDPNLSEHVKVLFMEYTKNTHSNEWLP